MKAGTRRFAKESQPSVLQPSRLTRVSVCTGCRGAASLWNVPTSTCTGARKGYALARRLPRCR